MFVRVKSTPNSPRKSVQIVESVRKGDKVSQKIVRYVGIAMDDYELEQLKQLAESIKIKMEAGNRGMLFSPEEMAKKSITARAAKKEITEEDYKVNVKDLKEEDRVVSGIHDVYGELFDELGYAKVIQNPARNVSSVKILKDIVLARIASPKSKRGSVSMLEEDFGITLNLDYVYRMMDKLDDEAIERLNEISYENTQKLYEEKIDVVFFDCTTLYFEAFEEDEMRDRGYSKDMKFNELQVLFALMVTKDGLPIGYQAFNGATYEGHTLIPAIQTLKEKYKLDKVVFVADSGMMNTHNIEEMEGNGIEYIVGTRLKNLPKALKENVIDQSRYVEIRKGYKIAKFDYKGRSLIVSYSAKRARKDAKDRERAIEKIRKKVAKQKSPKDYLSNYGYKKYLKMEGETTIALDEDKIAADQRWDGLLGVSTNAPHLSSEEVLEKYRELWQVEEAFRINKHDLKMRPVFHWKPSRVRAHIAIAFLAFSLVKYLEYRVKLQYKKLSPEIIRQTLIRVQTSILFDKTKRIRYALPSKMSRDARKIYGLMNLSKTCTPYILEKL